MNGWWHMHATKIVNQWYEKPIFLLFSMSKWIISVCDLIRLIPFLIEDNCAVSEWMKNQLENGVILAHINI